MLDSSRERIRRELSDEAVVLDVGGWASPLHRADWVLDLMPYETRGLYGEPDADPQRFTDETWVQRDMCAREPWPWPADFFDFVVCSHTLEDIRDPVFVCEEMDRVGRAGYIEVPSRAEEQTLGVQGNWIGWGHHHWLCDVTSEGIDFVFKHGVIAKAGLHRTEPPPEGDARVQMLWWSGSFLAREVVYIDSDALDAYLAQAVAPPSPRRGRRLRRRAS